MLSMRLLRCKTVSSAHILNTAKIKKKMKKIIRIKSEFAMILVMLIITLVKVVQQEKEDRVVGY